MAKDLVFIASGGRTGTNLFGDRLKDVIDDCWSEHEPDMFAGFSSLTLQRVRDFGLLHMTAGKLGGLRELGIRNLEGAPRQKTIQSLRRMREGFHRKNESLIVESYYAWWMFADIFDEAFPGSRMVGIVRNPYDWIASWLSHQPRRRKGVEWISRSVRCADWAQMTQVERLAWEWNKIAETLLKNSGSNLRIYRFEALLHEPNSSALEEMVEFIANGRSFGEITELKRKKLNASRRTAPDHSDETLAAVRRYCSGTMAQLGYSEILVNS